MATVVPVQPVAATPVLAAYPTQIGLFPEHIAKSATTIILKEKLLSVSGDDFSVKTATGLTLFKVKGKKFSISDRKHFEDANGRNLFDLRKELVSLKTTYYAEDDNKRKLFEVKSKLSIGKSKAVCTFHTIGTGKEETLLMKGDWFDASATIVNESNGAVVANINRKFITPGEVLNDKQSYSVQIAPGVDVSLIAAMCICLDEKNND